MIIFKFIAWFFIILFMLGFVGSFLLRLLFRRLAKKLQQSMMHNEHADESQTNQSGNLRQNASDKGEYVEFEEIKE